MDATEGARISLPSPDPTPQSQRGSEARRSQEAEARPRLRESAGAHSTSLAEASMQCGHVESVLAQSKKSRPEEGKSLMEMVDPGSIRRLQQF